MNELADITQRRAKKIHYCDDCGKPIMPGCEYLSIRGQENGRYFYKKEHIHCDAVINAYCAAKDCEVFYDRLDEVVEWLQATACPGCILAKDCNRCGLDTFCCIIALKRTLPPTVLSAAIMSVSANEEDAQ